MSGEVLYPSPRAVFGPGRFNAEVEPLDLDAIEADLDRRVPALDLLDRDHCRALLAEVRRLTAARSLYFGSETEQTGGDPGAQGAGRVPQAAFEAAVAEMSKVEKMHPRTTLDALLFAALPALGLTHEYEGAEQIGGER